MQRRDRGRRRQSPAYRETFEVSERKKRLADHVPMLFGGAMLLAAFAFAGHYMGRDADAHNVDQITSAPRIVTPASSLTTKASLLPQGGGKVDFAPSLLDEQEVMTFGKSDGIQIEAPAPVPTAKQPLEQKEQKRATPPVWKIEASFKAKRKVKQKVVAQRRVKLAEENCLARAIYFEARSESELGQLAVAKVILNRTKAPDYPKTICGVVYQGSDRRNSCQFSFACDGMPDEIRSKAAWDRSKRVAQKALAGNQTVKVMGAATNYHADYVKPKWSRNMKRLVKIGRHIFYSDS